MKSDTYVEIDNLEDMAAIAWTRAVVLKQPITVRCPEPEGFVASMLQITAGQIGQTKLSVQEFTGLFDRAKLVEASGLRLEKSTAFSYCVRA